ncbi:cytochrome P450 CYP12A2-like isoform X2 [Galleria mellonella]|uniref:Cytochrome P450 CYP12A2-like isoform X2 n=1 Tax=Galleria mellonella TaxID=7137 RepID=A0A6J1WYC9_GALME|nr:cytochrome P450 CYP12A2-like isoform X2 [Galleria mellonella]
MLEVLQCYCCKIQFRRSCSSQPKSFKSIPGLSSIPVLGSLHHFLPVIGTIGIQKNFFNMLGVLHEKYGSIVKMEGILARANMVILYKPEHFDQVYRAEDTNPLRPGFDSLVYYRTVLRKSTYNGVYGLTTAQDEKWRHFRTKVNPALLKPKLVKLYAPALDEIAKEMVDRLIKLNGKGDYLQKNLDLEMTKWALESIALVGLGNRLGCMEDNLKQDHPGRQLIQCARDMMELAYKLEFFPSLWQKYSTKNFKKLVKTYDLQWDVSKMYIDEAKRQINERGHDIPEEDKSILEKLLSIDENVALMMANEMLMAGIDTVAFSTTGVLYHLAINPEVQKKAREEARSAEPQKRYIRACIKESLRIYPVIPANLRRTGKDHIVAGYHIPKGIDVIAPNEFLSKLDKYYPRAKEFIPERWLVEKTHPLYYGNAHPMITLPFGFGIRSCIGRRIAEMEIETFLRKFLDKVEVGWEGPPIEVETKVMNLFVKPYRFKFKSI